MKRIWLLALCLCLPAALIGCGKSEEPDLSFLNYKNAQSLVAELDEVPTIYYPPDTSEGVSFICPGSVNGKKLAAYLDSVAWEKWSAPEEGLSSPGSIEFCIEEDYRITVYQKPRWVKVTYMGDVRYYKAHGGDYDAAVELFADHGSQQKAKGADMPGDSQ